MYEINGVEVTYEDLLGKAEELGLTFDEQYNTTTCKYRY
jgi:hypothetical protein